MNLFVPLELFIHKFLADEVHLAFEVVFKVSLVVLQLNHHQVELIVTFIFPCLKLQKLHFRYVLFINEILENLDVCFVNFEIKRLVDASSTLLQNAHMRLQEISRLGDLFDLGSHSFLKQFGLG